MKTLMDVTALDQKIADLQAETKALEANFQKTVGLKYAELAAAYTKKAAILSGSTDVPVSSAPALRVQKSVKVKVGSTERNYANKVPLRQVIWDVLSRGKPLKVGEIKAIIEEEKQWVSNSGDINPQIQQHLYGLKKDGKIERDAKEHTYAVVKGASL